MCHMALLGLKGLSLKFVVEEKNCKRCYTIVTSQGFNLRQVAGWVSAHQRLVTKFHTSFNTAFAMKVGWL